MRFRAVFPVPLSALRYSFFVISGFLISSIIFKQLEHETSSLLTFTFVGSNEFSPFAGACYNLSLWLARTVA
jgi:peptidoglycan/LPS O-acetylase OafA/YrhL